MIPFVFGLVATACAARKTDAPPPESPAKGDEETESRPPGGPPPAYAPGTAPEPAGQPAPPDAKPPPVTQPSGAPDRIEAALRDARAGVDRARAQLEASMSDCTNACRALASLERATGHLCNLATQADDRRRCEDAKTRVFQARDRIRASCGTCQGGPTLDKSAPIPSTP